MSKRPLRQDLSPKAIGPLPATSRLRARPLKVKVSRLAEIPGPINKPNLSLTRDQKRGRQDRSYRPLLAPIGAGALIAFGNAPGDPVVYLFFHIAHPAGAERDPLGEPAGRLQARNVREAVENLLAHLLLLIATSSRVSRKGAVATAQVLPERLKDTKNASYLARASRVSGNRSYRS